MRIFLSALLILLTFNLVDAQCTIDGGVSDSSFVGSATTAFTAYPGFVLMGESFNINSDFDIDTNVTWSDCAVVPAEDVTITIKSGYELIIEDSCIITPNGSWVGFVVEPGAKISISEGSTICKAEIAVHADSDGGSLANYDIRNSFMYQNTVGLRVANYTSGAHPGIIGGTTIDGEGVGEYGIQVEEVGDALFNDIRIGAGSVNNVIRDLPIGIHCLNAVTRVRRTEFYDIQSVSPTLNGYAIQAQRVGSFPCQLVVGGGLSNTCTFEDCRVGVDVSQHNTVNVNDNTFGATTGTFERAMNITQCTDTIFVTNNTISGYSDLAMFFDSNTSDSLRIKKNDITGTLGTTRGIFVDEHTGFMDIRLNTISDVNRAVIIQNLDVSGAQGTVLKNTIDFEYDGLPSAFGVGILSVESDDLEIGQNKVTGSCSPCLTASATNRNVRGIQQFSSERNLLYENTIRDCGAGIFVQEVSTGSRAYCNALMDCYTGFAFEDIVTGEYGENIAGDFYINGILAGNAPSDNFWIGNQWKGVMASTDADFGIGTGVSPTYWVCRDAAGVEYEVDPAADIFADFASQRPAQDISNVGSVCLADTNARYFGGLHQEELSATMLELIDSLLEIGNGSAIPLDIYSQLFSIKEAEQWLEVHAVQDLVDLTSIPVFINVSSSLNIANVDSVRSLLDLVVPVNSVEEYLLDVMKIQCSVYSRVSVDTSNAMLHSLLSAQEKSYLDSIVFQVPFHHARRANILAQSVLGVTAVTDGWGGMSIKMPSFELVEDVLLFPNPVSVGRSFYIKGELPKGAFFRLINLAGNEVAPGECTDLQQSGLAITIPGMYLLEFWQQDRKLFAKKLLVY